MSYIQELQDIRDRLTRLIIEELKTECIGVIHDQHTHHVASNVPNLFHVEQLDGKSLDIEQPSKQHFWSCEHHPSAMANWAASEGYTRGGAWRHCEICGAGK